MCEAEFILGVWGFMVAIGAIAAWIWSRNA
jgi:hypothetical protein